MPTGYTAGIADGTTKTFTEYAMGCARAFGALITMRDDPADAPIPEAFEASSYHQAAVDAAQTRLADLRKMTPAAAVRAAHKAWTDAETHRLQRLEAIAAQRQRYEAMLQEVDAWQPLSDDHVRFKQFMREQITQGVDFDCSTRFYDESTPLLSGEAWLNQAIATCARDIGYHAKGHAEEVERAASRTAWVRDLRRSLVV